MALLKTRNFTAADFARSHPGGVLGRRSLLYVRDIMRSGDEVPLVRDDQTLSEALPVMSGKGLGMTGVLDGSGKLCGVFTDGDLRRALGEDVDVYSCRMRSVMTADPRTVSSDVLAAEIIQLMRDHSINGLFVVEQERVTGAFNAHDLLRAGVW